MSKIKVAAQCSAPNHEVGLHDAHDDDSNPTAVCWLAQQSQTRLTCLGEVMIRNASVSEAFKRKSQQLSVSQMISAPACSTSESATSTQDLWIRRSSLVELHSRTLVTAALSNSSTLEEVLSRRVAVAQDVHLSAEGASPQNITGSVLSHGSTAYFRRESSILPEPTFEFDQGVLLETKFFDASSASLNGNDDENDDRHCWPFLQNWSEQIHISSPRVASQKSKAVGTLRRESSEALPFPTSYFNKTTLVSEMAIE